MEYLNHHRNKPYYICKRLRLLEHLRMKGFIPYQILPDVRNPKYLVWMFENTPELADAVEEFLVFQQNRTR